MSDEVSYLVISSVCVFVDIHFVSSPLFSNLLCNLNVLFILCNKKFFFKKNHILFQKIYDDMNCHKMVPCCL